MKRKTPPWLAPLLWSLYPILLLLASNIDQVSPTKSIRSFLFSAALFLILYFISTVLLQNNEKAGVLTSGLALLFFTYGHVYNALETTSSLGRHRYLLPLWLLLAGLLLVGVLRGLKQPREALNILTVIPLIGMLLPSIQIGRSITLNYRVDQGLDLTARVDESLTLPADPPDVYFIILDGYGRADSLQESYGLDNSAFIAELESEGFYMARCSQSNYTKTNISLSSTLNMAYIEDLLTPEQIATNDRSSLPGLIKNSRVRETLSNLGYSVVAFETGFNWTEWHNAHLYLSPFQGTNTDTALRQGLNAFERLLLRSTLALAATDSSRLISRNLANVIDNPDQRHRARVEYILEQLALLPNTPSPKFVFAHVVSPHKPFVFAADGSFPDLTGKSEKEAYAEQLSYLNTLVLEMVRGILENSKTPPIILIQSDHGGVDSSQQDRVKNLGIYYLPGGEDVLYPQITPVNSFRVVFNTYFGGNYELLPDETFFSIYQDAYDFQVMANDCK